MPPKGRAGASSHLITRASLKPPTRPGNQCAACFRSGLSASLSRKVCKDCQAR